MHRSLRTIPVVATLAATAVLAAACGSSSNPVTATPGSGSASPASGGSGATVTIGSANFPENELLADIYADALKAKGVKVATKLNIGSREVIYKLIQSGQLDVLPEYNGALLAFLDPNTTATTEAQTDSELQTKVASSLEILDPSAAEDKDSLNVTKATAQKDGLTSIPDLSKVASTFTLGGPPEFKTRRQGIVGLKSVYGLTFKGFTPLDEAGPLTINALKENKVQVADIFSTDPSIVGDNFVTLADPKGLFGAQNVTPLVYKSAITPTASAALNAVSAKLDTATLAKLVAQVVNDKTDATTVAQQWVSSVGLG